MRGSAHPKRRLGACLGLDGLTAPFDGVAFGRAVLGAADGGGAHLAPARRLRAHLSFDYLERDAFRFLAPKITPAIVNNLLRRPPRAAFLCHALTVVPCTLRYQSACCKNVTGGLLWHQLCPIFNRNQRPRPPRRRRPLSVTVLSQKLRLLQTSSLHGDTIYTRCPSWVTIFRRRLPISRHVWTRWTSPIPR